MEITVKKMYLKVSPRKVRPVLFNIKRKKADIAIAILKFDTHAVSRDLHDLLKSGVAAFKDRDLETEQVFVKNAKCDEGPRLKRRRLVSKGRASAIQKRMCHLSITLSDTPDEIKAKKSDKSAASKIKEEAVETKEVKKSPDIKAKKTITRKKTGLKE